MNRDKLREAAQYLHGYAEERRMFGLKSAAEQTDMAARILDKLASGEWAMVPTKITDAMIAAARKTHEGAHYLPVSLYDSMLAAAPDPLEGA